MSRARRSFEEWFRATFGVACPVAIDAPLIERERDLWVSTEAGALRGFPHPLTLAGVPAYRLVAFGRPAACYWTVVGDRCSVALRLPIADDVARARLVEAIEAAEGLVTIARARGRGLRIELDLDAFEASVQGDDARWQQWRAWHGERPWDVIVAALTEDAVDA